MLKLRRKRLSLPSARVVAGKSGAIKDYHRGNACLKMRPVQRKTKLRDGEWVPATLFELLDPAMPECRPDSPFFFFFAQVSLRWVSYHLHLNKAINDSHREMRRKKTSRCLEKVRTSYFNHRVRRGSRARKDKVPP